MRTVSIRHSARGTGTLLALALLIPTSLIGVEVISGRVALAQAAGSSRPASPFAGVFSDGKLTLQLQGDARALSGTISLNQKTYKAVATGDEGTIAGTFSDGEGHDIPFSVARGEAGVLVLKSGTAVYQLKVAAPAVANAPAAARAAAPANVVRFIPWQIKDDPTWTGEEVSRGVMPDGWKLESKAIWDMHNGFPFGVRAHFTDADDLRAYDTYPAHDFFWSYIPGQQRQKPAGSLSGNTLVEPPPADQFAAILDFVIPVYRPDLKNAKVTEKVALKEMSKITFDNMPEVMRQGVLIRSGRVRFEYELHGKVIEEDVSAVYLLQANQQLKYAGWNISGISSVRGPKGTLDEVKTIEAIIQRSIRPGAAFWCKYDQFIILKNQQRTREIEEVGRRSRIFAEMANKASDAQAAQYWKRQDANARLSESRALYNRSLTQYQSSNGGPPINLPNNMPHAWQGANGQILQTNNPNYNPNGDPTQPSTQWTPMQQVKP